MCVAIPGEIIAVDPGGTAEVDFGGVRRTISLALVPDAGPGDFVIVHAGFALHRVDPDEARETQALFRELVDGDPAD